LLDALKTYTSRDQDKIVDNQILAKTLMDNLELIDNDLFGYDYSNFKELDSK
jgi:hypothetical protein